MHIVKAFLPRAGIEIEDNDDPTLALLDATGCITAESAYGWFKYAGYITVDA